MLSRRVPLYRQLHQLAHTDQYLKQSRVLNHVLDILRYSAIKTEKDNINEMNNILITRHFSSRLVRSTFKLINSSYRIV